MTSGFGTQNLGYNDKEIANARIEFIKNENLPFSRLFFDKNIALLSQKFLRYYLESYSTPFFLIQVLKLTKEH